MGDLLITVAPTGAETTKADCPQLPTTLAELVETAQRCEAAGAAMVHVHIRDDEHRPTLDQQRLADTVAALRESTDLVVQLSTGGSVHDPLDDRLRVLDAEPDSCSLTWARPTSATTSSSTPGRSCATSTSSARSGRSCPEFELFDLGQVAALHRLLRKYGLPYGGKVHVDLVMGVPGGMPGTADALVAAVAALPAATTSWSATGIGRSTLAVALASLSKGGHLRVGMEDVLTLAKGVPVEHNEQLVSAGRRAGPGRPAHADDPGRGTRAARDGLSRRARSPAAGHLRLRDGGRRGRRAGSRSPGSSYSSGSRTTTAPTRWPGWCARSGTCGSCARSGRSPTSAPRSWWSASSRCTATPGRAAARPGWQPLRARSPSRSTEAVCAGLERQGTRVERGVFGADMTVELANDGPVTMILET